LEIITRKKLDRYGNRMETQGEKTKISFPRKTSRSTFIINLISEMSALVIESRE